MPTALGGHVGAAELTRHAHPKRWAWPPERPPAPARAGITFVRTDKLPAPVLSRSTPMPVRVVCPSCATQLNIKDEHAGRPVKCPKCGYVIPPAQAAPPVVPPGAEPP